MTPRELVPNASSSLVQVKVGNRVYDARYSPKCHTCNHPARMEIELAIAKGWAYKRVSREFSNVEYVSEGRTLVLPEIGWQNLRAHFTSGHMPIGVEAQRRLSERRANEIGSRYEEAAEQFVDHYVVAQAVMTAGYERLVSGEVTPDLKETLAAAKMIKEIEDAASGSIDNEAWSQAMGVYFETAQAIMAPDTWREFIAALSKNPDDRFPNAAVMMQALDDAFVSLDAVM